MVHTRKAKTGSVRRPGGTILSTVPFRFKGVHECDAIVAAPISFNFAREILDCVEYSFQIKAFDLFAIPSFSKHLKKDSETVLETIRLAFERHRAKQIFLFQHVDFHNNGGSSRFKTQIEEDYYHKAGLVECYEKIKAHYPEVQVRMVYARLVDNQKEIEISEIFLDQPERVRMVTDYRFKGVTECPASVLFCLDFRFRRETRACIRESLKIPVFDLNVLPGSSRRPLLDSPTSWKGLDLSCGKHGCKTVVLVHHAECLAYKKEVEGLKGGAVAEERMHRQEMRKLKERIKAKHPQVKVIMVYARLIEDQRYIQFVRFE